MDQTTTILNDLKQAMKDKKADKVSVLRMLVAELKNKKIEKGDELTNDEVLTIAKKEVKKRNDAIEMYKKASRQELVDKEKSEREILKSYLPEELSKEEVKKIITKLKEDGEIDADFSKAMKVVMAKLKGQADGKMVVQVVKEIL